MNEPIHGIDFNSAEWRASAAQKREALISQARGRPRNAWQPVPRTTAEEEMFREAARLGAEWRARANREEL
ncbi:MAG: hypothetical protein Q8M07_30615 [Prosthecobacter sp.]|nr:hypothetical protein [Prosthecobacter sp.]HBJ84197.1 hypothetical protein [Verrucomicrobiales bacterium]